MCAGAQIVGTPLRGFADPHSRSGWRRCGPSIRGGANGRAGVLDQRWPAQPFRPRGFQARVESQAARSPVPRRLQPSLAAAAVMSCVTP